MPLAIGLLTAGGAFFGVRHTARGNDRATEQRDLAARREEWWRRFTWAADLARDESEVNRALGLRLLTALARSDLAQRDEVLLLEVFSQRVLSGVVDNECDQPEDDETEREQE